VAIPGEDDWLVLRVCEVVPESGTGIKEGGSRHAVRVLLDEPEQRLPNGLPAFGQRWGADNRVGRLLMHAFNSTLPDGLDLDVPIPHLPGGWGQMTGDGGLEPGGRRKLGPVRAIAAAIAIDLGAVDDREIALMFGLLPNPQYSGSLAWKDPLRHTRDAACEGRRILGGLGVWPWVHASSCRLPENWWELPNFIRPLSDWREHYISRHFQIGILAAVSVG
jgi:hypothetical protein